MIKNWTGNVCFKPKAVLQPRTIDELQQQVAAVSERGGAVRAMGARHSFSPMIACSDSVLDMRHLQGLVKVDPKKRLATFLSGTSIRMAGRALLEHGLALPNQGDIDEQTLAGAMSTGTHGTGLGFASLSEMMVGATLVTHEGRLVHFDEHSPNDELNAVRVSLGSLGVFSEITIRCEPAFFLRDQRRRVPLQSCLDTVMEDVNNHRHYEFFWFPYSDFVTVKTLDRVPEGTPRSVIKSFVADEVLERYLYQGVCELAAWRPALSRPLSRFCGRWMPGADHADRSHRVYPSSRKVRFNELEYALPLEQGVECFRNVARMIETLQLPVYFPVEFRVAKKDDAWLSPMYGRDSAIISLHVYHRAECPRYFNEAESIFKAYGGRPHWGKLHHIDAQEAHRMYAKWEDFGRMRARLDPEGCFLNEAVRRYFMTET